MVLGAMPAALRRSALLIFLSMSSFQSLLYEIAISVRPPATNIVLIIHLSRSQGKRASHRVAKLSNFKNSLHERLSRIDRSYILAAVLLLIFRSASISQGLGIIPKSPRVRTAAVLAILSNLNIRRSWCPRFFESGDIFSSPILKKRQRNVRCIVEGFWEISRNFFRTKGKNMSVCYMEGKFFALPP